MRGIADTPVAQASSAALIAMVEGERDAASICQALPAAQSALMRAVLHRLMALEA